MNTSHLIPIEQVTNEIYCLNKSHLMNLSPCFHIEFLQTKYTKSPNQYVKLKVYLPYCRSHPAHVDDVWPLSQLLGCSSNQFYFCRIKNLILEKFAIPKFLFQRDAILWFVHTSYIFRFWWKHLMMILLQYWKRLGVRWLWKDLSATIQPNEEKLNDKELIEIWKRKQGESGPSQWAQQCSSEWGDKELTNS